MQLLQDQLPCGTATEGLPTGETVPSGVLLAVANKSCSVPTPIGFVPAPYRSRSKSQLAPVAAELACRLNEARSTRPVVKSRLVTTSTVELESGAVGPKWTPLIVSSSAGAP